MSLSVLPVGSCPWFMNCLVIIPKTSGGYGSKLQQEAQQQLNSAENHMAVMEHML